MKYDKNFIEDNLDFHGERYLCRAIRPSDKEGLIAGLEMLSFESRKNRFLSLKKGFTSGELQNFTNVNFIDHVAFCVLKVDGDSFVPVGTARFVKDETEAKAEFAITIIDQFQGMGFGSYLMDHLIAAAKERSLTILYGTASIENEGITKLLKKKGKLSTKFVTQGVHELSLSLE